MTAPIIGYGRCACGTQVAHRLNCQPTKYCSYTCKYRGWKANQPETYRRSIENLRARRRLASLIKFAKGAVEVRQSW